MKKKLKKLISMLCMSSILCFSTSNSGYAIANDNIVNLDMSI